MHTYSSRTRPALSARAVPGKHAKSSPRTDPPGKTAGRVLITGLLAVSMAAGTAATYEYGRTTSNVSAHHQSAIAIFNPWMY